MGTQPKSLNLLKIQEIVVAIGEIYQKRSFKIPNEPTHNDLCRSSPKIDLKITKNGYP